MFKFVSSGLVGLFIIGAVFAAPPTLTLPKDAQAKIGRLTELEAKGDFKASTWTVKYGVDEAGKLVKPSAVDLKVVCDGKTAYFATMTPGEYVITVTAWNPEGLIQADAIVTVTGQITPTPPVPPTPPIPPTPPVPPAPTAKNLYVAIIRDTMTVTPAIAAVIGDTPFWDELMKGGSDWDLWASNSEIAATKGYIKQAQIVQEAGKPFVPVMVILNRDTAKVVKVVKLPETKDGVKAVIEGVRK